MSHKTGGLRLLAVALTVGMLLTQLPATLFGGVISTASAATVYCSKINMGNIALSTGSVINTSTVFTATGLGAGTGVTAYFNAPVPFAFDDNVASAVINSNLGGATSTSATVSAFAVISAAVASAISNTNYTLIVKDTANNCDILQGIGAGSTPANGLSYIDGPAGMVTLGASTQVTLTANSLNTSNTYSVTLDGVLQALEVPILDSGSHPVLGFNVPASYTGAPVVHTVAVTLMGGPGVTPPVPVGTIGLRVVEPAPSVSLSSTSGPAGTIVTISGIGFGASAPGTVNTISISNTVLANTGNPQPITTTTSLSGTFSYSNYQMPALNNFSGGPINFTVNDNALDSGSAVFNETALTTTTSGASLNVSSVAACTAIAGASASVAPNQQVGLSGTGFNNKVSVLFSTNVETDTYIPANGFFQGSYYVHNSTSGLQQAYPTNGLPTDLGDKSALYPLSAVDSSGAPQAQTTVGICPTSLSVMTPTVAAKGTTNVNLSGFSANTVVSFTYYINSSTGITNVNSAGVLNAFNATQVTGGRATSTSTTNGLGQATVPIAMPATFGLYTVRADDASGLVATGQVSVVPPAIVLTPTVVYPTFPFTVSLGSGFVASQVITLTAANGMPVTTTTTAAGGFTTTVTAPANSTNPLAVTISTASLGSFNVTEGITVPTASLAVSSGAVPSGSVVTVNGAGYIPNQPVSVTLSILSGGVNLPVGPVITATANMSGTFTAPYTVSPSLQVTGGSYTLTGVSAASSANTASTPIAISAGAASGATTQYFAEGFTGRQATAAALTPARISPDFNEVISVLNPNGFATPVTFTYYIVGVTTPTVMSQLVPANSSYLASVNTAVGNDKIVSAIVSSPYHVVAERIINRALNGSPLDGNSSFGATQPSTTQYFAEGYTGLTFQEYLTVMNPTTTTALVTVTFMTADAPAATPVITTVTVAGTSRATININQAYPRASQGMVVTSSSPVVAERVLYWGAGAGGSTKYGSDVTSGLSTPARQWLFPYGSNSNGDESYVTIINPNATAGSDATVLVSFYQTNGTPISSVNLTVSPNTRQTVAVNNALAAAVPGGFVTVVNSDQPIIAEHPQYIGASPNMTTTPGANPVGTFAGSTVYSFPSANASLAAGAPVTETVSLYNPGTSAISVLGTYYTISGTKTMSYNVPANGTVVVNVNADAGGLPAGPAGSVFTSNSQFVAVRSVTDSKMMSVTADQGGAGN